MTGSSREPPAPPASRALATALWVFYAGMIAVSGVLDHLLHKSMFDAFAVTFTAFATVGWLLAYRRPRQALGWLFLAIGVLTGIGVVTDAVVQLAVQRHWQCHGIVMLSAWCQLWFWYPLVTIATAYTLLLFPNGLPSRRWRPVLAVLTAALTAITVMAALSPTVEFGKAKPRNPIGISFGGATDVESTAAFRVATVLMTACIVASIVSLFLRFRRSRGIERAQLKWFLLAGAVLGATFALSLWPTFNASAADDVVFPLALACLPVSCGLAILRYRLYDIDRIVSRTVSYALVTGLLVGSYVGIVALTERVLSFSSSFSVAASTLAVAALFQPLRRRVQRLIDRRFDRAAYHAGRTVEAFSARLRDQVDVDTVCTDLVRTVSAAVAPTLLSLWVSPATEAG